MIQNDFATTSDSFYFSGGKLIVHNKAAYSYNPEATPGPRRKPRPEVEKGEFDDSDEFD